MKDLGTLRLETGRLVLRPFAVADAPAMYRNWASDPEVTRFLTWPPHDSVEGTRALLEEWSAAYADPTVYQWAIVPKALGEPIGSIGVVSLKKDVEGAELGWCIGRPWWHQGFTSEAAGRVIAFLFEEVGLGRVAARHDVENPNSGGVMRKCGMTCEGTLRKAARNNRGIVDAVCYGILREDYEKGRDQP